MPAFSVLGKDGTEYIFGQDIHDGLPLFAPFPWPFATPALGALSVCVDNGVLTQAAYPDAYAQLVILQAAGEANIVTMAQYAAQMTANGGICGRFALDTTAQTFRIPCMPGHHWEAVSAALGTKVGDRLIDTMRPITGGIHSTNAHVFGGGRDGAFTKGADTGPAPVNTSGLIGSAYNTMNSANLGPNYSGSLTRPQSIASNFCMKLYGTVTEASEVNIAALVAATAGKLDTSVWEAAGGASLWCPGDTSISLSVPANGGTVTAPGDGWLTFYAVSISSVTVGFPGFMQLGFGPDSRDVCTTSSQENPNSALSIFVPCRKGQAVYIYRQQVTNEILNFTSSIGNQ